jgi:hypothetical protein
MQVGGLSQIGKSTCHRKIISRLVKQQQQQNENSLENEEEEKKTMRDGYHFMVKKE